MSTPTRESNGKAPPATPLLEVSLDFDTYTGGELEEVEDAVGGDLPALLSGDRMPPQKVLNALLWITLRRAKPDATLDDARAMTGKQWTFARPDPLPSADAKSEQAAQPDSAPSTA